MTIIDPKTRKRVPDQHLVALAQSKAGGANAHKLGNLLCKYYGAIHFENEGNKDVLSKNADAFEKELRKFIANPYKYKITL